MMKILFLKFKYEFLIILIGLLWIETLNFLLQLNIQNIIYPDSESYFESAQNIYIYQRGHNYRPIVLAAIQGIPFLFGFSNWMVYKSCALMNFIFWIITSILIYKIGLTYFYKKTAFLIAVITLFCISSSISIFHLLSENIYIFFIVLTFYFLQEYYKKNSFKYLAIALSILTVTMLIRPGAMLLAIGFIIFFLKELYRNYNRKIMFFFYLSWLLVFIQCVGLKYQFGNFTISYIDSVTYYNYLGSKAICLRDGKEYNQMNNPRGNYIYSFVNNGQMIKKTATDDLVEQLMHNKFYLFYAYLSDIYDNSTTGNTILRDCVNIKNTSYFKPVQKLLFWITIWQNKILTIGGFFIAVYSFFFYFKKIILLSLISFFVIYTIILSGVSCSQGDRFNIVFFPLLLLLASKFIADRIDFQKVKKYKNC